MGDVGNIVGFFLHLFLANGGIGVICGRGIGVSRFVFGVIGIIRAGLAILGNVGGLVYGFFAPCGFGGLI